MYQFLSAKLLLMLFILASVTTEAVSLIGEAGLSIGNIVLSISLALFSITAAVFLCAFFGTTQKFILSGNLLVFYCIVVGGGIIPIQFLPEDIIRISKASPVYYMIRGIILLNQGQTVPAYHIAFSFVMISVVLFGVSLILFYRRSVANEE
jgi:ABC-type uncharacterized transport system permease subunit